MSQEDKLSGSNNQHDPTTKRAHTGTIYNVASYVFFPLSARHGLQQLGRAHDGAKDDGHFTTSPSAAKPFLSPPAVFWIINTMLRQFLEC